MFNLSPIYSARKSPNHKSSKNTKSILIQTYTRQYTHKHQKQNFLRISPFGITPVIIFFLKHIRVGRTRWYRGPFRRFINTRFFFLSIKKEWTEVIKIEKILYICILANTSAIWQHAAHNTDHSSR